MNQTCLNLRVAILCILAGASSVAKGQLPEFIAHIDHLNRFSLVKSETLKITKKNNSMLTRKVDETFRKFVLESAPKLQDSFRTNRANVNMRFYNMSNKAEVSIHSFFVNEQFFDVYAFTSSSRKKYFIKDRGLNRIVYENAGGSYLIDSIYELDDKHFLLIEKFGDLNSSRKAIVFKQGKKWKALNGFFGKTRYNDVPKKRQTFILYCYYHVFNSPKDINRIIFDRDTKMLFFKKYLDKHKFEMIKTEWKNQQFELDDINATENLEMDMLGEPAG